LRRETPRRYGYPTGHTSTTKLILTPVMSVQHAEYVIVDAGQNHPSITGVDAEAVRVTDLNARDLLSFIAFTDAG